MYDDGDKQDVLDILNQITQEIYIDKTYVAFDGTGFEKTFLIEPGWNALRDLVIETNYGRICTKAHEAVMRMAYRKMIEAYVAAVFADLGWDVDAMEFAVEDDSFEAEIVDDVAEEWKRYPGRWQTWEEWPGC